MGLLQGMDAMLSGVYRDYVKLVKYLTVGIVGTLADWIVYTLVILFTETYFGLAIVLSYSVGMVINYALNRRFTFNSTYKKVHYQFASFALIAVVGLGVQEAFMYGLVHYLLGDTGANTLLLASRVAATFVGFTWTFIANKKITFKRFR